jgi:hypothetical protein
MNQVATERPDAKAASSPASPGTSKARVGSGGGGCLLLGLDDDALLRVASAVANASALARLALTCRRLGMKLPGRRFRLGGANACVKGIAPPCAEEEQEELSLVEEAGRRWVANLDERERRWVPRLHLLVGSAAAAAAAVAAAAGQVAVAVVSWRASRAKICRQGSGRTAARGTSFTAERLPRESGESKAPFLPSRFCTKNDHFTETGSGQT